MKLEKLNGFENTKTAAFLNAAADARKAGEKIFEVSAPSVSAPAPSM